MSLTTWLWGISQADEAFDKATSELLPSGAEDIALNLEISDQIRSKSIPAKDAVRALKRRLNHKNPNVQLLALGLTDTCIKNGGDHFLVEIASRDFMDNLVSILKMPSLNLQVKSTILRLVQNWALAFEGKVGLAYVDQVYKTLKSEGFNFPPRDLAVANSAMVDTKTAPEWIDSDVCLRCRTPFSFTNRKHHCRNCGQVFDQACSSRLHALPHFGIDQEVRVCDGCYPKLTKTSDKSSGATSRPEHGVGRSVSAHNPRSRSRREQADAELQRAIQLSLEEVGAASGHARPSRAPIQPTHPWSEPPLVDRSTQPTNRVESDEDDPDLKAAIEASLREATAPKPSAPMALETPRLEGPATAYVYSQSYPPTVSSPPSVPALPNYDLEPLEADAILTFSQTVEQVEAQGGHDISKYPAVNELFDKANGLRPKLAMTLDDTGRKEQMLSEMHDKLSQAVRLYDQLLTDQISHRTRSPPPSQTIAPYSANASHQRQWSSPIPLISPVYHSLAREYAPSPGPPPLRNQHTTAGQQQEQWRSYAHADPLGPMASQGQFAQPPATAFVPQPRLEHPHQPQQSASAALPQQSQSGAELIPQRTLSLPHQPDRHPSANAAHIHHHAVANTANISPQQQHTLPNFPVAPTLAPQAFPLYAPALVAPSTTPQVHPEREAMLIDL